MKRNVISNCNETPNFIGSWVLEPLELCDGLIDLFESNSLKQKKGTTASGVNVSFKKSTDISIFPYEIILPGNEKLHIYFEILLNCYKDYVRQWPFLLNFAEKVEIGSFNIQRYLPGEHFQKIHSERTSIDSLHRIFAFMTYLNDVEDGGSTHFTHYDIEIQPQKGLTLIWPAEWTHAHRGNVLKSGSKYIITGWIDLSI